MTIADPILATYNVDTNICMYYNITNYVSAIIHLDMILQNVYQNTYSHLIKN